MDNDLDLSILTPEFIERYRRDVTREEALAAFDALRDHNNTGRPIADAHLLTLMALAVEKHAPKREEAQRGAER